MGSTSSTPTPALAQAVQNIVDRFSDYKAAADKVSTDTQAVMAAQTALDGTKAVLVTSQNTLDDQTIALDNAITALQAIAPPLPASLLPVVTKAAAS